MRSKQCTYKRMTFLQTNNQPLEICLKGQMVTDPQAYISKVVGSGNGDPLKLYMSSLLVII